MPATTAATVAASPVIGFGENHEATDVEVKIPWHHSSGQFAVNFPVKGRHADFANARFASQIRRDSRGQFVRNNHRSAPARSFVRFGGAKLTIVWLAAQWTVCWIVHAI